MKLKALTTCVLMAGTLFGQESSSEISVNESTTEIEESREETSSSQIEKIEVTGSLIKRVDVEGPSPVQTIDREAIEKAGHNSVGDILRNLSSNSFGSLRERSGSNAAGVANVSLRGLGASNTLVLMNGQRMARDGVVAAPDLNLIPVSAIDRIEILKDGASATYGSDALGGVVNVITKKDWNGTELAVRHEQTEEKGGEATTISMSYGSTQGKLSSLIAMQGRNNTKVMSRDREWTRGGESSFTPNANYQTGANGTVANPTCPADKIKNGRCTFDFTEYSSALPEIKQGNLLTDFNYQLSANTEIGLMASGTYKEANWNYAPNAAFFTLNSSFIDGLNLPGHTPGQDVNVRWRALMAGNRNTEVTTRSYRVAPSLTQYLSDTWELKVFAGHEEVKRDDIGVSGYLLRDRMEAAANSGVTDVINNQGFIPDDVKYVPKEVVKSDVTFAEARVSGELIDMPAGPMAMALGAGFTDESYSDKLDAESLAGNVLGSAGSDGEGKRQVNYVFTEFAVPLHETLEAQISGRFDSYSDFGQTTNPKLAVKYKPTSWLMVRASAGTSFKAPGLQELYGAASEGAETFVDHAGCANGVASACTAEQYTTQIASSQRLKEEESKSYNLGVMIEPSKSFSFGVDVWQIETSNIVGVDLEALTEAERDGVDLSSLNTTITRNGAGEIALVETELQNISERKINGMDFVFNSNIDMGAIGQLVVSNSLTYLFNFEEAGRPGEPLEETLKTNSNLQARPQWRNNLSVDYIPTDRLAIGLAFLSVGKYEKDDAAAGNIGDYTSIDAQVAYALTPNSRITIGGINVLGTRPNLDDSNVNNKLDGNIHDPKGRRYFMGYKQTF